jgi:HEAT repeat protein
MGPGLKLEHRRGGPSRSLWRAFSLATLLAILLGLLPAPECLAFSYRAMSEVEMTCAADTIAVGVLKPRDKVGNTRVLVVERVLKGEPVEPGTIIKLALNPFKDGDPPPSNAAMVVWLSKPQDGAQGEARLLNFSNSVKDPTQQRLDAIARAMKVLSQPAAHFPPADDLTAEALCHWISRAWFDTTDQKRTLKRDAPEMEGVTRDQLIKLLCDLGRDERSPNRGLALALLVPFETPASFNVFLAALEDKDRSLKPAAANGLKALRDARAVPHLVRALESLGDDLTCRMPICDALGELGNPAAVPALIQQLQLRHYGGPEDALTKLRDPRAVPALVEAVWKDGAGVEALLAFDHPSILDQAAQRMYDHPCAPYILAVRGAPAARPLVLKLIRQRDPLALIWVKNSRDREAALLAAVVGRWNAQFLAAADQALADVDDPRAVSILARLLLFPGHAEHAVQSLERRLKLDIPAGTEWPLRHRRVCEVLLADPDRFALSPLTRRRLKGALERLLTPDPDADPFFHARVLPAWPHEWPNDGDADAKADFVRRHREAFNRFISDPDVPETLRAELLARLELYAMEVLDEATMKALLRGPVPRLHRYVLDQHARGRVALSAEDVRVLYASSALAGWLHHVARTGRCDHPEVLQEIIERDWGANADGIHAALRATRHTAAVPRLRALLVDNTIDVRREAAVTLAHVGDASGRKIIEQELARYRAQKYQHFSWGEEVARAQPLADGTARIE